MEEKIKAYDDLIHRLLSFLFRISHPHPGLTDLRSELFRPQTKDAIPVFCM